jgi:hypothetical protein
VTILMDTLEARGRQLIEISNGRLLTSDEDIHQWISLQLGDQLLLNLRSLAKHALVAGQIEARVFANYEKAKFYFVAGAGFGLKAIPLKDNGSRFLVRVMEYPLYCALLAGMYGEADKMAREVLNMPRLADSSAFYDGFARLISSAIADDESTFKEERAWVDARRSKNAAYWWEVAHGPYHDLLGAILSRDVALFLSLMNLREASFAKRPTDRKMRDVDLKDGGNLEQNALVIDYMGTAIAKLARHRGMDFEYSSTFVPAALLK